jgi:acyl transferase domain-containing protein/acyl-CoA synthetase (AMP-forming)/AMP-acid ligase II/acyl carrier protein
MTHSPTLIERLELRARSASESPTFNGRPLARLREEALRVARALRERGLAGQPVLVAAPAGVEYVTCLLGCLYAGAIAVPAYPPEASRLSRAQRRVASILADANVRCALGPQAGAEHGAPGLPIERLELEALLAESASPVELAWPLDSDAVCLLQYTSGSTSIPKGVAVSLGQLSANLAAISEAMHLTSKDVLVTWLPPYHDMGLMGGIFWPLYAGAAAHILAPDVFVRRPLRWLQEITRQRATVTMAPDFAFELCVRRIPEARRAGLDLSRLRVVCNGAEPIRPETLEAFAAAFGAYGFDPSMFYPCYGLAEATLFVAGGEPIQPPVIRTLDAAALEQHRASPAVAGQRVRRVVSCGRAAANLELAIVDPDSQRRLSDNQVGEIWVSGGSVATGYWNRPDETRARFRACITGCADGPFLRTGDLGFVSDGQLFVTGRLKDVIVVRGQNHYPHDLEHTVQSLHPALQTVRGAAFSIDVAGAEQVVVVHELDTRIASDPTTLISELLEAVRREHGLALHACVLVKRGTVARTASGKVQRRVMRRAYVGGALDVVARWDSSAPPVPTAAASSDAGALDSNVTRTQPVGTARRADAIARFLRNRIAQRGRLAPEDVDLNAPLARYAIDSLAAAELSAELEAFLGEPVPATISYEAPTIAALAQALAVPRTVPPRVRNGAREVFRPARESSIAIVGMSCRFPGAPSLDRFWELLANGQDAISESPSDRPQLVASGARFGGFIESIDRFDAEFFGISEREAARMDPQQRLFLELAWTALEDAGIPASSLRETEAGVFAGVCTSDYALLHAGQLAFVDADYGAGHAASVVANRVSYTLDLRGPSLTVDTACSSSLVALHLASESLRRGECNVAIVGGVNAVLAAQPGLFFAKAHALAKNGRCKTFDATADGFVRSEGCGVIVLKRWSDAQRDNDRVYALVEGSATNHDGCSNGLMAPSLPAQERLIRAALRAAALEPDQLDYVEAHGVGTPLSDAVELRALGRVLGPRSEQPCWVGSVKTNIGHLEAASGIAGVIKTALALAHERIPAHLHLNRVSEDIDLERLGLAIPVETRTWARGARSRFAGVSAFGFGGTNAHVVLRESPVRAQPARSSTSTSTPGPTAAARGCELLALSAKDPEALRAIAAGLAPYVTAETWSTACFTLNTGRDHFTYRAAVIASDAAALCAELARVAESDRFAASRAEPRVAFAFEALPARPGVARALYAVEPVFRTALERAAQIAEHALDAELLPGLLTESDASLLEFPQSCALVVQHALHALLEHWRVTPSFAFGAGTGEYAAACVAGVLGWHDALRLVARRELLLKSLVPGARVRQTLAQFKRALAATHYAPAALPLVAAGLDRQVEPGGSLDARYWLDHLYARPEPARGIRALRELEPEVVLAIGHAKPDPERVGWLSCLAPSGGDVRQLLDTVARLYERGVAIDFAAFHAGFEREKLGLPTYPFQRKRCWLELEPEPLAKSTHPFLRASSR